MLGSVASATAESTGDYSEGWALIDGVSVGVATRGSAAPAPGAGHAGKDGGGGLCCELHLCLFVRDAYLKFPKKYFNFLKWVI